MVYPTSFDLDKWLSYGVCVYIVFEEGNPKLKFNFYDQ